jgi:hypothetical protein
MSDDGAETMSVAVWKTAAMPSRDGCTAHRALDHGPFTRLPDD